MGINWSPRQKAVIEHRNKNMLVSAAAGSGKTAVLVERIISLLTDEENPADLDRMLVLTFTKAAAGEMKERIRARLEKMAGEDTQNEHLRNQSVLIHNARISTIHSFCSQIVKNYFYTIDIDPSFRTIETAEQKLIMSDCAKEVLSAAFEEKKEDIIEFAASYGGRKDGSDVRELIINAYNKLTALAWPDMWMESALIWWEIDSAEELAQSDLIAGICKQSVDEFKYLKIQADENLKTAQSPEGPSAYIRTLEADVKILDALQKAEGYAEIKKCLDAAAFLSLGSGKPKKGEDGQIRESVKSSRNNIKTAVEKIKKDYFGANLEGLAAENRVCRRHVRSLVSLIQEFSRVYSEKKRAKNLMDFADLEHFALKILVKRNEDGTAARTEAAKETASQLDYVMTDEYQDSNDIQELILSAVSRGSGRNNNRFMVGDIKQSIYGFRNANPEIFVKKYDEYAADGEECEVIDLHDNYRSCAQVIDTLNYIFKKTMTRAFGGVDYDESQALHMARQQQGDEIISDHTSEILLMDADASNEEEGRRKTAIEAEGMIISAQIRRLMDEENSRAAERRLGYNDFAVLVRTGDDAESICKILQEEGIPAYTQLKSGYFNTVEVMTVLNYISILDNPLQDIPFAAILFSPIVGCTTDEMAKIRLQDKRARFAVSARLFADCGEDEPLAEKLKTFFKQYDELFEKSKYMNISRLISEIYEATGYRSYAAAMPAGAQRAANLDMLLLYASAYEKTSYTGLFDFIRYIEEIKSGSEDVGEASLFSGGKDAVSVMTIHKSKGLEFPVVFLAGCAKQFNYKSASEKVLIHEKMGIGIDAVDYGAGKKKETLYKNLMRDAIIDEAKSEELRVLYVALTRAKEKLYIVSAVKKLDGLISKVLEQKRYNANSFIEIILNAFSNHKMFEPLAHYAGIYDEAFEDEGDFVKCRVVTAENVKKEKMSFGKKLAQNVSMLPTKPAGRVYDGRTKQLLDKIDAFTYPFAGNENVPVKVSVSDIKRMYMSSSEEQAGYEAEKEEEIIPYIPGFISSEEKEGVRGAERGTAYHKLWRYLDYKRLTELEGDELAEEILKSAEELTEENILSEDELKSIRLSDFTDFFGSKLGRRMINADAAGKLVREQPFTALMSPEEIEHSWNSREDILVQGVIDAYFEEDGAYVVVDYKTDRTADASGDELIKKYRAQLEIYAKVLEKDGKRVKEKLIYSTHLKKWLYVTT